MNESHWRSLCLVACVGFLKITQLDAKVIQQKAGKTLIKKKWYEVLFFFFREKVQIKTSAFSLTFSHTN